MTQKVITVDQLWEAMTEPERNGMVYSRELPMWFIKKYWDEMTRHQQHVCITHQRGITLSFYADKWASLDGDLQRQAVRFSRISDSLVRDQWEVTHWFARTDILLTMRLSEATHEKCWELSEGKDRDDICRAQRLSTQFIEAHWHEMTEEQKKKCYISQHIAPEFAIQHFEELDEDSRKECMILCINKSSERLLPSFLTSSDGEIRRAAMGRMYELLTPLGDGRIEVEVPTMYEHG